MNQDKKEVYLCPFCNQLYQVNQNLSLEENLAIHEAMDCTKVFKEDKKPDVCAGKKCKAKLTELNKYQCKLCAKNLCLKHRMAETHQCIKV